MPKNEDLKKHTLNLRAGDMDKISEFFPDTPASTIIRALVSRYVDEIQGSSSPAEVEIAL